jgi:prepilin-type N-terminal cleavage/methylation domain-containing protein
MKRGFTLIELLVYMAIMGFIIVVAGRVFSDSTAMRVRSQNMLKSTEVVGSISDLIKEDISQMGVKASDTTSTSSGEKIDIINEVYWKLEIDDSSSYTLVRREGIGDSLVFKKADFDGNGKFLGVRKIYWAADTSKRELRRGCMTIEGNDDDGGTCPIRSDANNMDDALKVLVGNNITRFHLTPSKPGRDQGNSTVEDTLLPSPNPPNSSYKFVQFTGGLHTGGLHTISSGDVSGKEGVSVQVFEKNSKGEDKYSQIYVVPSNENEVNKCYPITLKEGETYAVQFKMPFFKGGKTDTSKDSLSTQMQPGVDHIAVGFRNSNGEPIENISSDVLFYPPQDTSAENLIRHAEFSTNAKNGIEACLAITFAFYSGKASKGKIRFSDLKIFRKKDEAFSFETGRDNPDYGTEKITLTSELIKQKKDVKAFELVLEVDIKGEKIATDARVKEETEKRGMIIATPNNGM